MYFVDFTLFSLKRNSYKRSAIDGMGIGEHFDRGPKPRPEAFQSPTTGFGHDYVRSSNANTSKLTVWQKGTR